MVDNVSGAGNTAVGGVSLINNVNGFNNTVVGIGAGGNIVAGNFNVYIGTDVGPVFLMKATQSASADSSVPFRQTALSPVPLV